LSFTSAANDLVWFGDTARRADERSVIRRHRRDDSAAAYAYG